VTECHLDFSLADLEGRKEGKREGGREGGGETGMEEGRGAIVALCSSPSLLKTRRQNINLKPG